MPCRTDGYEKNYERSRIARLNSKLEATLCGIMTANEEDEGADILDHVDWKEAGVKREWVEKWWVKHQEKDRKRKERKAKRKAAKAKRREALEKLTPEERQLLNL